jgi:hypothetical protein
MSEIDHSSTNITVMTPIELKSKPLNVIAKLGGHRVMMCEFLYSLKARWAASKNEGRYKCTE